MEELELDVTTIRRRSVHGVLSVISRQFVLSILSFVTFVIISQRLSVKDVGIYTAVLAIQRVISFFTDFGIGAALVQKKDQLRQEDLMTSFTLQVSITGFILILTVFFLHPLVQTFRIGIQGGYLLLVLVFTIFLSSFKIIPSILLERSINFSKLVIPQIAESLTFNIVLIVFILMGHTIDSYTYAFLISGLIGIPFYYAVSRWKLQLGINKNALLHLRFGLQFQGKNILATIKDDLLTVILTRILSFSAIGYIGFAQKLAFFVYRYIVDSVTKVTFSTYSRIQHDTVLLRSAIEKSLFFVSSIMFPLLLGLATIAPYLIHYFPKWHNKWEPATLSLIFFCLNAAVSSLSGILVNVLDSTGNVKWTLQLMIFWTTITWILTPLLIWNYGYNGVPAASFIVSLTIGITVFLVRRVTPFTFFGSFIKPLVSAIIMVGVVYLLEVRFATNLITLLLVAGLGGVCYIGSMYVIARPEIQDGIRLFNLRK